MTFGEKLQKLRKEKGWTQEELAAQICISRQALSKWEQGTVIPDTENVLQISKLFGVSTDYLLHDDYTSDRDIPAVRTTDQTLTKRFQNKTQMIVSSCIAALGAVGFFVLALIGRSFSVNYPVSDGGDLSSSGFGVFLDHYELGWLVWLCVIVFLTGVALLLWSLIQKHRKNK